MSLPYQCVTALGQTGMIVAARGTIVFTFGVEGSLLASWEHPATQRKPLSGGNVTEDGATEIIGDDEGSSPAKKRKVETSDGVHAVVAASRDEQEPAQGEANGNDQKKTKKGRHATRPSDYKGQDQPYVNILRTTSNGSHVVAVTAADKAVWVFEHDGRGQLKQLSQRSMPKRPCDLAVTADDKTILVADKFGDVYSLPLIPSSEPEGFATQAPNVTTLPQNLASKGANSLTVHSQRNRKALVDQERQRQLNPQPKTKEGPTFVHELLIGHVSMLTAVTVASAEGKPYILTADRDEHIRVSRGIPQAYVIENFCLGHRSFINALCLPRPNVLVSGGGDNELYVWDWRVAVLREKVDLLGHVQKVVPEASKVAISRLVSSEGGWVMVICERVPAAFVFRLVDDKLMFTQTLELPGNVLDLDIVPNPEKPAGLVVGIDNADSQLTAFQFVDERWEPSSIQYQPTDIKGLEAPRAELDDLFYNAEKLRKIDQPYGDEEGETPAPDSEAAGTPADQVA
ncbi:hypothetical protein SCAR479_06371 [Seiridium cardinale]|uniref:Transfer RNA methyltransferase 82 n=1 Tax=Seiridium cardinale TaxID=138064 RepID=A0ABR2XT43_9PEZI